MWPPGGLVELTTKVATGELDNGFALIRYYAHPLGFFS
jgi:hypothetical protein